MGKLEDSVVGLLESSLVNNENKQRDISLILWYYGFGDAVLPTQTELAARFETGTSRERARQIIAEKLCSKSILVRELNGVKACVQRLDSISSATTSHVMAPLYGDGILSNNHHPADLLHFLSDMGCCSDLGLFTPEMQRVTRGSAQQFSEFVFVKLGNNAASLTKLVKSARKLPSSLGAAKLSDLALDAQTARLMRTIIANTPGSWTSEERDDVWFLFEDRENVLLNLMGKTFATGTYCDVDRLAETIHNALHRRTSKSGPGYPPQQVIRDYILGSTFTSIHRNAVSFEGEVLSLSEIERKVQQSLSTHGATKSPPLKSHLKAAGFGDPAIIKAIHNSPLVFVDKSGGRKEYLYSLVAQPTLPPKHEPDGRVERYEQYRDKLKAIARTGTDRDAQTIRRREQDVLSQWLFEDRTTAVCAICGQEYEVQALVCAHKKRRSECSKSERSDPYIVMPLCLFGCD